MKIKTIFNFVYMIFDRSSYGFNHIISGVARIFFGGDAPAPERLSCSPAPQGVRGGAKAPPPDGSEVSFFQTMQSIRKWIEFSKISIFSCPKIYFFLRKNSKNWTYLTGIYECFRKIIWKFSNFMKSINPEKISGNSLIWLRNLQWSRREFFRRNARAT